MICFIYLCGCDPTKSSYLKKPLKSAELSKDIFQAILKGDILSVKVLVHEKNADLSLYDDEGYTALARALHTENYLIVDELVNSGVKNLSTPPK